MTRFRELREAAGLTQAELAVRSDVSRQTVSTIETGRHLPRVDAAIRLSLVLGVDVGRLFGDPDLPVDVTTGAPPAQGSAVRVSRVGDLVVTSAARTDPSGFDVADAVVGHDGLEHVGDPRAPGLVVAGCEPGLLLWERLLRAARTTAVAVTASTRDAVDALAAGRLHAAVVHGPADDLPHVPDGLDVRQFALARWQVGLAAPPDATGRWWEPALRGRVEVVQRNAGAGVQAAFERAATAPVAGPLASSHVEAAGRAVASGTVAVTIEPAALAAGAVFHPLETHVAEVWVDASHIDERLVQDALHVLTTAAFRRRLLGVGGYDLAALEARP